MSALDSERDYWVCETCSYGVSGLSGSRHLMDLVDQHEADTGHRMNLEEDG